MTAQTVDTSKLWDMIRDIRFGMLTVRGSDGRLYSRPMTTQNRAADQGGVIWFFLSRTGQQVADVTASPEVNVTYSDSASDRYVSVSGTARLVEDQAKLEELWNSEAQRRFPGGIEGSDLALVAILVAEAEYWDVKADKAVQIFKLARAAPSGEEPADLAEHRRVRMR